MCLVSGNFGDVNLFIFRVKDSGRIISKQIAFKSVVFFVLTQLVIEVSEHVGPKELMRIFEWNAVINSFNGEVIIIDDETKLVKEAGS